jgi:hypothetical protein
MGNFCGVASPENLGAGAKCIDVKGIRANRVKSLFGERLKVTFSCRWMTERFRWTINVRPRGPGMS